MRLIKNKIEHGGSGEVTLCPEEPEDMVNIATELALHCHWRVTSLITDMIWSAL